MAFLIALTLAASVLTGCAKSESDTEWLMDRKHDCYDRESGDVEGFQYCNKQYELERKSLERSRN